MPSIRFSELIAPSSQKTVNGMARIPKEMSWPNKPQAADLDPAGDDDGHGHQLPRIVCAAAAQSHDSRRRCRRRR